MGSCARIKIRPAKACIGDMKAYVSIYKKTYPLKFALPANGLLLGVKNGNVAGMKYSIAAKGARKKRNN